ncbi:MAG: glycoside hydrolase family 88 protein [Prevotellaceae bacterium]|jgi:rhamnogalacturonyl hydrolase YesR|nr:glycoside hydrolase family 88 protein [Prevotellaceae bacterium]
MKKPNQPCTGVKLLLLLCLLYYCPAPLFAQANDVVFTLKNSATFDRVNEVVEVYVPAEAFASLSSLALYDEKGAVTPYQVLPGNEKKIIFQAAVPASSTATYTLKAGTPTTAATQTYGRQVASRYDDAAWENDLAAYRMYSKKLLASEPNTANGVDLWLKKQAAPIIDKMYAYSDYHSEKAEGVDAYSVDGKTLGVGGIVACVNNKLWLHDPYDEYQLIANGPLRTEFLLTYNKVEVDGDFYTKTVRITANANGLLNKAVVKYKGKVKAMKLASGIYKHSATKFGNANPVIFQSEPNLIGFAESKSEGTVTSPNARIFEGVYMPGTTTVSSIDDHLVIMSDYVVGTEFTYYFGGGWNIFPNGRYASDNAWFDALKQHKEATMQPLCEEALPAKAEVINVAVGVNNAWIAQNSSPGNNLWARSVYNAGNIDFYKVYPEKAYLDYANLWAKTNNWAVSDGPSTRDADNHTCGQTYIDLYNMDESKDPVKIQAIKAAIDYRIANNPQSDDWWWIDAMFMAMPTLVRLGNVYSDPKYYDKLYALFSHIRDSLIAVPTRTNLWPTSYQNLYGAGPILRGYNAYCGLFNETDGLWWRDWGYQPNVPPKKEPYDANSDVPKYSPNGKNVYWARGNGWAIAAMARTLQLLPETDAHRQEYVGILTSMAAALKRCQREDGFWNMNLDDPNDNPGPETSGTALFTYGIAWGINAGLLDRDQYLPTVAKAWKGLSTVAAQPNGNLQYTQNVGEKPIPVNQLAGSSVDFGVGAFLLAVSEVVKLAPGSIPEIPVEPLGLEAVNLQDATHLQVTFDKELDTLSAQTATSYNINGVAAKSATLSGAKTVSLTLSRALDYGRHTLFANNVRSKDNSLVDPAAGKMFVYPVPLTPLAAPVTITAIGNQTGNPPNNTVDNNLSTRWAQAGFGQWITYDLQKQDSVWAVDIAFYLGHQRVAYFDVELSSDNVNFAKTLSDVKSSGLTTEMERYTFPPQRARYVRIVCNSNSSGGENWNSITEVRIPGLPPGLIAVNLQDSTHLLVTFDKELDTLSAKNPSCYSVDGVTITEARLVEAATVALTLSPAPDYGRYTLYVAGVSSRGVSASASKTFVYPVPLTPLEASVTVDASGSLPDNTIDNSLSTGAQLSLNQWITYDLQKVVSVWAVDLAYSLGNLQVNSFDIELSSDNVSFTKTLSGVSSGLTTEMERYAFSPQQAQYVRIVCKGNGAGEETPSIITEARIRYNALTEPDPTTEVNHSFFPEKSLRLFPNPVSGKKLSISWENGMTGEVCIRIFNITGQLCLFRSAKGENNGVTITDLMLPVGAYILTTENGCKKASQTLIVQ